MNQTEQEEIQKLKKKILELEKMSSLGVLNAGIMHEIQNPLNFILNFSKMSSELMEELVEWKNDLQTKLSDDEEDDMESILELLEQNMQKIQEHGERVNSIVKGILGFSRSGKQEKRIVKLNDLVSQYVGFSYHAMRVNAKGFNASIDEDYDDSISDIIAYQGDLSRAILNITNNAFFAVWDKSKTSDSSYKPGLKISTCSDGDHIKVSIEDNGMGIPEDIKESLFEPFFTTKPEDQGTGLGLYITRQIVEEAHEGSLTVESEAGKFTRFTIRIPRK